MITDYVVESVLDANPSTRISLVHNSVNSYIMKELNLSTLDSSLRSAAHNEVNLLSQLTHPFIVSYIDSILAEEKLYLITEYCARGDLARIIKTNKLNQTPFKEAEIVQWFISIALALKYIHSQNILHRDIKSANIFLTSSGEAKLGDFGISKTLSTEDELAKTVIGTPYYLSPELCEGRTYNKKSDIWALGCVLYELTTLNHAFNGTTLPTLVLKILNGTYAPIPKHYSDDLKQLIDSMLQQDPNNRPTITQLLKLPFLEEAVNSVHKIHPHLIELNKTQLFNNNASSNNNNNNSIVADEEEEEEAEEVFFPRVVKSVKQLEWERQAAAEFDQIFDQLQQHQQLLKQKQDLNSVNRSSNASSAPSPPPAVSKSVKSRHSLGPLPSANNLKARAPVAARKSDNFRPSSPQKSSATPRVNQLAQLPSHRMPSSNKMKSPSSARTNFTKSPQPNSNTKIKKLSSPPSKLSAKSPPEQHRNSLLPSTSPDVIKLMAEQQQSSHAQRALEFKKQKALDKSQQRAEEKAKIAAHLLKLKQIKSSAQNNKFKSSPVKETAVKQMEIAAIQASPLPAHSAEQKSNESKDTKESPAVDRAAAAKELRAQRAAQVKSFISQFKKSNKAAPPQFQLILQDNFQENHAKTILNEATPDKLELAADQLSSISALSPALQSNQQIQSSDKSIAPFDQLPAVAFPVQFAEAEATAQPVSSSSIELVSSADVQLTAREQRLVDQINALRLSCSNLLGVELFPKVYESVKKIGEAEDTQSSQHLESLLHSLLSAEQLPALRLIQKLIYCEQLFYL
jgi:serine/threonine protein kinase